MEIGRVYKRIEGKFCKKEKFELPNGKKMKIKICFFKHCFICIEKTENSCIGVMITHSSRFKNNFKFSQEHILEGNKFKYDNSYFMAQYLLKEVKGACFEDCGCLTEEGLAFVRMQSCHDTLTWEDYEKKRRLKKYKL